MSMGPQQCRYGSGCGAEGNGFPLESPHPPYRCPAVKRGAGASSVQEPGRRIHGFRALYFVGAPHAGAGALGEGSAASGGFRGAFLEMAFFCN